MKNFKRPAAMLAATVVALAMVSPTAALATNGDRGNDRAHEASERREAKGDRDRGDTARGERETSRQDKAKQHDNAKADRAKADSQTKKHDKAKADRAKADTRNDKTRADQARHDGEKADRARAAEVRGDKAASDKPRSDSRPSADARGENGGPWNVKATLCHATSSETNPYVLITVSHKSIVKGTGHGGHGDDIIPPFTYRPSRDAAPVEYPGKNWDDEGQAVFAAGCSVEGDEVAADAYDRDKDRDKDGDDVAGDAIDRDRGRWNVKATLCHATGSETNPYVMITVSHKSIVKDAGHGSHDDDIIPPFAYQPHRGAESAIYPGLNWDAEGQELFANGCVVTTDDDVAGIGEDRDETGADTDGTDTDGIDTDGDEVAGIGEDRDTDGTDTDTDTDGTDTDEVLGVVIDDDAAEGDDTVADTVADDTATATEADVLADTEVQAAQSSDEEQSAGVLAMTGGSLLVLLIAGLASLFAGTGLLRRRS